MRRATAVLALLTAVSLVLGTTVFADETEVLETEVLETEASAVEEPEKNGEVYILYTSDVHCGVEKGFGYAGLEQIRSYLEDEGYTTILVDDGDSIQGEVLGTVSKGESIVELMNDIGYDVAIPGNHEFDYGMDRFLELTEMADYPYISCNFNYKGDPVFDPYVILEAAGLKIGFVGVTTPKTITSSTPAYFQDEEGNYVYGFLQEDTTGQAVYDAVQDAVDSAREDGADLVYVMGHVGMETACQPWTYADIISHTNGIDVFLDGHSHDTEQVVMKNKDGEETTRSAVGTKLNCVGYSHISAEGEILETGIWSWPNDIAAPKLLGISNQMSEEVDTELAELEGEIGQVVATSAVDLTIYDPEAVDETGNPVRMVRRAETNLGDVCADAYRDQSGADIAFVNGGGIRVNIEKGDITYGEIISVHPFGNLLTVIEVTGQQILDALEWGSHAIPEENGGFLQVSGLTYEIDSSIDSTCTEDENGNFISIEGERRVSNVMVGDEPIDPEKTYTLASHDYMLLNHGDGYTMLDGAEILQNKVKLDNQVLIDYIQGTLGGVIGEEYADPFGQGRIVITE